MTLNSSTGPRNSSLSAAALVDVDGHPHIEQPVERSPRPPAASPRRPANERLLGRDWKLAWLFMAPLVVIVLTLIAYPFVVGLALSFQDHLIGGEAQWIGFGNFLTLLTGEQYGPMFWNSVQVTFIYTTVGVGMKLVFGLCMALLLNEKFKGRTLMRGLLFIPWAVPTVVVGLTWRWLYTGSDQGLFNMVLGRLGVDPIPFLSDPSLALWAVILTTVWQGAPFYTMMLLAGMQSIPAELYEAAALDGAGPIRRFINITLPSLKPAIIITTLLSTIWTTNTIEFIFVMTNGGPLGATMTFPMLAYQIGLQGLQLGLSSAVSVMFFPVFLPIIYVLTRRMLSSADSKEN